MDAVTPPEGDNNDPVYRYRAGLMGGELALRLSEALVWSAGSREGRIPYAEIKRVRLAFRPTNIMTKRCVAEIWPRAGMRLSVASSAMRSLLDAQDHGPAFRAFVLELVRRIGAAGDCRFEAGFPAWRWWPMAVLTVAFLGGAALFALKALVGGELMIGLATIGVGAVFGWQVGNMVVRNRPRTFAPDAVPSDVLPSA
jgi:hypothetical protein